jgi:membrane protease YdiL (CAAX protease family)
MISVFGSAATVIAALVAIALIIRNPELYTPLRQTLGMLCWLVVKLRWIPGLWWLAMYLGWILRVILGIGEIAVDQWRAIDDETVRDPGDAGRTSLQVLMVLFTVAASLTLQEYFGGHDTYEQLFPPDGSRYWELTGFAWWAGWRVLGYVIVPVLVLACLPGQRIADYHISPRGFFRHLWIYAVLFSLVLPAVLIASRTSLFRQTYPFYRSANRSCVDLVVWELLYAAQFLSLEFFFRGFILQGLRRALGANAIFVMLVPYCMIHYGKPLPETLGAIGAGLILGTLAMRTRSIWGGVLIHVGVATTMDVLALRGCPPFGGAPCH